MKELDKENWTLSSADAQDCKTLCTPMAVFDEMLWQENIQNSDIHL